MFKTLKLQMAMAARLGAFKRLRQTGLSNELAFAQVNQLYPPTAEQVAFEHAARRRGGDPMDGMPIYSSLGMIYFIAASVWGFFHTPTLLNALGFGIANLGYVLVLASLAKGTFLFLNLRTRGATTVIGILAVCIGAALSNFSLSIR